MSKRRTSNFRTKSPHVLHLKVRSGRIYWCMTCRFFDKLARWAVTFALVVGAVWGVGYGLRRTILRNEKFQLRFIDLTPNHVLDEQGLLEISGIDPNGNLFDVDLDAVEKRIAALPAIAAAHAERELPGVLHIRILERNPIAWLEIPEHDIPGRDLHHGLLIDNRCVVFPCPPGMVETAVNLPVVVVSSDTPAPEIGEKFQIPELTHAIELLNLCRSVAGNDEFPIDRVEQEKDWSILMRMRNGVVARFGLLDQERQMADLIAALRYAKERKYDLASINLIPQRNIPVTFASPPPPPPPLPRAIPVAVVSAQPESTQPVAVKVKPKPAKPAPVVVSSTQPVAVKIKPAVPHPSAPPPVPRAIIVGDD